MKPPLRVLLAALLLLPPRLGAADDVSAAQDVSKGVRRGLDGTVNDVNSGNVAGIYGERQPGDPGSAAGGSPRGTGATVNLTAALPEAQLPKDFQRDAGAPPPVAAPSQSGGGFLSGLFSWFSSAPQTPPPAQPVDNPAFVRPCPNGQPTSGCIDTMMIAKGERHGFKMVPLSDLVEYGTLKYKGRDDAQIWDDRPWWKFWADPRQVSPDDIKQGGLNDCFLMSSLAAVAHKEPEVLRGMIQQQQGSLTVYIKFHDGEPPQPVLVGPVDELLPVYKPGQKAGNGADRSGTAVFARPAGRQGAIWPLLIEKAYAIKFMNKSYAEFEEGGVAGEAMTRITGQPSHPYDVDAREGGFKDVSFEDLVKWDAGSQPITMLTKYYPKGGCPIEMPAMTIAAAPPAPSAPGSPAPAAAAPQAPSDSIDICEDPLYKGRSKCEPGSRDPVCAGTGKIVTLDDWHVYWVKSVDASAKTVTLANPLAGGRPDVTWPWSRLKKSLHYVFVNDKAP